MQIPSDSQNFRNRFIEPKLDCDYADDTTFELVETMAGISQKFVKFLDSHRRSLTVFALVWTALSVFAFDMLWIFYEPYSLTFYLEGRAPFSEMQPEEVPVYIRFIVFIVVMTLSTALPLIGILAGRYLIKNGRV